MKISLALGARRPLSLQTAWGCFSSNLAVPGSGSLVAGRPPGYPQLTLAVSGFVCTILFGARFVLWYFANRTRMLDPDTDPIMALTDLWFAARWAMLGIALFGLGWLWALTTSLQIVREARNSSLRREPPILNENAPPSGIT